MNKIFITGGSGKIGSSIIDFLLKKNELVVTTSRNINNFYKKIHKHENLFVIEVDFEKNDAIKKITSFLEHNKIEINCLIHNARSLDYLKIESDNTTSKNNFIGEFYMDVVFPYMLSTSLVKNFVSLNNIIFISSIYGVVGNDQRLYEGSNLAELYSGNKDDKKYSQPFSHSVYPVVKGGVISLTRYLAAYWGEKNIRVNCISPGGVYHEGENETFVKKYSEKVPLGRKADVKEVASAAVFLVADESNYITGQNIIVDGGWTAW